MTATDRTTATPAEFDALLARIEAAPAVDAAEDAKVERVARALFEAAGNREPWLATLSDRRPLYRRLAVAALRALRDTGGEQS